MALPIDTRSEGRAPSLRAQEWDERKTHFDTNHLHTIIWDRSNLDDAAMRMTATIRATLPAEAKMSD
jgi:hypothetical protein